MRVSRRQVLGGLLAGAAVAAAPWPARAGEIVGFVGQYQPGTIVIITNRRELYYVLSGNRAIRYPVGVGRAGMAWHGRAKVALKLRNPAWRAPPSIKRNAPVIPGGSSRNPMGVAVLGLDHGNYGIHGTNNPSSVGKFVSHGCIRLYNHDIQDLYQRAHIGTPVVVLE